jgi:hypothetical protein
MNCNHGIRIIEILSSIYIAENLIHIFCDSKMKMKYHTVGTVPKSHRTIILRGKIDTLSAHLHEHSMSWLDTLTSIKSGGIKLVP